MPTPTNAPTAQTGPGARSQQNPTLFAQLTERQEMPQTSQTIKGLGKKQSLTLEKVGVVAQIQLIVEAKFVTPSAGRVTINPGFPYNLIKEIALEANGVTGIIDCSGKTLEMRKRRIFRNAVSAILKSPKVEELPEAKKEESIRYGVIVPIAHDMLSILGALLAQNEETGLSITLTWADEEELFLATGAKIEKFEGEVLWDTTVFSIGSTTVGKQEVTILPDLSAFHGLLETETPFTGTGNRRANLIRNPGQLLCYTASVMEGFKKEISPLEWTKFAVEYGGNKDPRVWTPALTLLETNANEYDGPLNIEGCHYLAIDNEADNPTRDMIIPEALTELRSVVGIPSSAAAENAVIITTQETLYPAV